MRRARLCKGGAGHRGACLDGRVATHAKASAPLRMVGRRSAPLRGDASLPEDRQAAKSRAFSPRDRGIRLNRRLSASGRPMRWAAGRAQDVSVAGDAREAGRYALKYTLKPADVRHADRVFLAMKGRRILEFFGAWHRSSLRTADECKRRIVERIQKPRDDAREQRARYSVLRNQDISSEIGCVPDEELTLWRGLPWSGSASSATLEKLSTRPDRDHREAWRKSPALWRTIARMAQTPSRVQACDVVLLLASKE